MSYRTLYYCAIVVTVLLALWTGISAAGGERLGLSPVAMAWLTVIAGALGILNGFLPQLQRTPATHEQEKRESEVVLVEDPKLPVQ